MKIVLDDIIDLIESLKKKIKVHETQLSKNEALVRSSIIDPFLRSLGWDTSDPSQVIPEFSTEAGRPDYALFTVQGNGPKAFVGAKKLGKAEDLNQHISYCVEEGVEYFIATDGQKWEIYDTFKRVKLSEKKIVGWNILTEDSSEIAKKALSIAHMNSFGILPTISPFSQNHEQMNVEAKDDKQITSSIAVDESLPPKGAHKRPLAVIIDGERFEVSKSNQILIEVAEWLILKGKMTKRDQPIESGRDRWLVNKDPIHKNGNKFFNKYELSNGLFLEMNYGSRRIVRLAKRLLKNYGYSTDSLVVKWS